MMQDMLAALEMTEEQFNRFSTMMGIECVVDLNFEYDMKIAHLFWGHFGLSEAVGKSREHLERLDKSYIEICKEYGATREMVTKLATDNPLYDRCKILFGQIIASQGQCLLQFRTSYKKDILMIIKSNTGKFTTAIRENSPLYTKFKPG